MPTHPTAPARTAANAHASAPGAVTVRTAAQTLERFVAAVAAQDVTALPDLYAEDVDVEHVLSRTEPRRWRGLAELRATFAAAPLGGLEQEIRDVTIHQTADPEVAVAEYVQLLRIPSNGREATVANVVVATVRDGRIVRSRDYHDHQAVAELFA